ncbi:MAG: metallophosphoesterase [Pleurocapsa sp. MO_192.B19]|nr:metallophosphoesterase [Pleurocapsa sp. MO_192.B19]
MKRRSLLSLAAMGGLGFTLGSYRYLSWQYPLTYKNCPSIDSRNSSPQLRFAVLGDVGEASKDQYRLAKTLGCYSEINPFSLVLLTGDNIYENGEIEKIQATFELPYQELLQQDVKFHAVLGNHDIRTKNGEEQISYEKFNMQGRYYTFNQGNVRFFALDTNPEAPWLEQLSWLEQELAITQQPWKVIFGHHQIYSSGKYGINTELIDKLTPLFSRYGVQLYINGHEHHYERTKAIARTTYLTSGAGAKLRPVEKSDWTAYSVSKLSFAVIEVYANRLEILGVGTDGQVFDRGIAYI